MTYEEAKAKAVEKLFTAIAHMNDYEDDKNEEHLDESMEAFIDAAIELSIYKNAIYGRVSAPS